MAASVKKWRDVCTVVEEHNRVCRKPLGSIGLNHSTMRSVLVDLDAQSKLRGKTPKRVFAELAGGIIPRIWVDGYSVELMTPHYEEAGILIIHANEGKKSR